MIEFVLVGVAVVALVALAVVGWLIGLYNTFVVARQDLREQWSNIKTEYQRRADLILNLVATAKGSLRFEKETLTAVTQARAGFFGDTKKDEMKNLGKMNTLFANLMGRVEAYPKLESLGTMHVVMEELKTTENRINIARTDYNETARDYNVLVMSFPARILAARYGFELEDFFESDEESKKAPRVSFEPMLLTDTAPIRAAVKRSTVKKAVKSKRHR